MFRTITAQRPGVCKRCRQGFGPGTRIRYGGPGQTYHLSAECPATTEETRAFYESLRRRS